MKRLTLHFQELDRQLYYCLRIAHCPIVTIEPVKSTGSIERVEGFSKGELSKKKL